MTERVLTARELNRALLQRQGLLERTDTSAAEWIERLVGLQAQEPMNPYVALAARTTDYDPAELSTLLEERLAVRAAYMRGTLHLVSAADALAFATIHTPLLKRIFLSQFRRKIGDHVDAVTAAGRELLDAGARTRAEIAKELEPRWPDVDRQTLGLAVTYNLPLVQTTPRGVWGKTQQATWALTEQWLGAPLESDPSIDELILRYLAVFGPATVADARTWSTLNGLRDVFERLRPQLRTFRDDRGRELFDVPDGALPDPSTPAPPRFLPEYDNVLLSHDDRSRMLKGIGPGPPWPTGKWIGNLLADGFFRAYWKVVLDGGTATLTIDRFTPVDDDPPGLVDDVLAEGERLLELIAPDAGERRIVFEPSL